MRRRLILGGTAAALAAAVALLGGVLGDSSEVRPASARPAAVEAALAAGVSPGDTAASVRALEARVYADGRDVDALVLLGLAYQLRARETGDPSFYPRSNEALRRAVRLEPRNHLAVTGLAALAASRHRFGDARRFAQRAVALSPDSAPAYGILGDALVELGQYHQAFAAFDRMSALRPSLASYTRIAYARELLGRPGDAREAFALALAAGSGNPENTAWTLIQLGNLEFDLGRLGPAEHTYRRALAVRPAYVHAQAGLARVAAARGQTGRAVVLYRRALAVLPLPQYAFGLGDTLVVAGRTTEAEKAYALVDVMKRLFEANGVRTELETALFDLDRDRALPRALKHAGEAFRHAPSIHAEDVLAWALYKNGRCDEARAHSVRALRLGTLDALKLFHRGMIERCLGRREAGRAYLTRALAVNPHFSLVYAPVARRALR
jgi:tetratricopeptide (TPR) repeat protein